MVSYNSTEIERQEKFVRQHYQQAKKQLPSRSKIHFKSKLRQCYHHNDNNDKWIVSRDWNIAESRISLR